MRSRGAAAAAGVTSVVLALLAATLAPAAAAADNTPGATLGGPLLAAHGLVVRPLAGAPALPKPSALPASSWMVTDLTTGQVLAAKDPHGHFLPASTLKTLTAATLLPRLSPASMVKATAVDADVDGTRVGLVPNRRYSVSKLFQCMLMFSANDAADALAQANGGIPRTLTEMNAEAHYLRADDTHADTPSGLDGPGESTSAYDLALIAAADFKMPAFRRYVETAVTNVPAPHHKHFQIQTHNRLLTTYRGDIGGKNGYTVNAMGTYVGAATRHGQTILVTLLHANPYFWPMAQSLLTWGFHAVGHVQPIGSLVSPMSPSDAVPLPSSLTQGPGVSAGSRHSSGSGGPSDLELALVAITVVAASATALSRIRRARRRSRRMKLPRAY